MAPPPAPKGGGNILTRKFGPLPGWAWAAIGVGAFFIYKQRKASEAAAAASSTTSTASPTASLPTSAATAPSGYGYSGPGTSGFPGGVMIPAGATAATSGSSNTSTFIPLTASQGSQLQQSNPNATAYYQVSPGVFASVPITSFTPTSPWGQGYIMAPPGYSAPSGVTPVTGVVQS